MHTFSEADNSNSLFYLLRLWDIICSWNFKRPCTVVKDDSHLRSTMLNNGLLLRDWLMYSHEFKGQYAKLRSYKYAAVSCVVTPLMIKKMYLFFYVFYSSHDHLLLLNIDFHMVQFSTDFIKPEHQTKLSRWSSEW